eukprot:GFKZ01005545.1.p1 GENE.GFKZ01005545.1~~GFKZ01005545.1.p1  ORF type:complete len:241 (+),score=11.43 GFKZ01005545.1:166-888(+)
MYAMPPLSMECSSPESPASERSPPPSQLASFHTPFYCEENAYHLLTHLRNQRPNTPPSTLFAIFISNPSRQIQYTSHRLSPDTPVVWDYHVIAAHIPPAPHSPLIYDLDSLLPLPSSLPSYIEASFPSPPQPYPPPQFRVVPYTQLTHWFSSDRRHMRHQTSANDTLQVYKAPPPCIPCISASHTPHPHTLPLFLRMTHTLPNDEFTVSPNLLSTVPEPGHLLTTTAHLARFFDSVQARL